MREVHGRQKEEAAAAVDHHDLEVQVEVEVAVHCLMVLEEPGEVEAGHCQVGAGRWVVVVVEERTSTLMTDVQEAAEVEEAQKGRPWTLVLRFWKQAEGALVFFSMSEQEEVLFVGEAR